MTSQKIQAIIFDLGRVLVAIDDTLLVERLFKGLAADDSQQLARRTMADPAMIDFNSGRISSETFYERMRSTYQLDIDFEEFKNLWCRIFYPMEGMEELVMQLVGKVTLGLLSDTDPLHWNYLIGKWSWLGIFKNPTLSFQIGVMKPAPAIYRTAAENVDTPPQQCLYIDDLEDNVQAARAVGMSGLRFESVPQLRRCLTDFRLL